MNLNMEGTKHEKAILVILAYVVGFTAGFLTFGLNPQTFMGDEVMDDYYIPDMEQTMPVIDSNEPEMMINEEAPQTNDSIPTEEVSYKDGRLMANVNGATVLLSAQMSTLDSESAAEFAEQGAHTAAPNYSVSLDGNYIYYCEQHSDSDSCLSLIYDVTEGSIHYVTNNGGKVNTTVSDAAAAIWNDNGLALGGFWSESTSSPWSMKSAE